MKTKLLNFLKKEVVLWIALTLAIVSCFWVRPDEGYLSYIDFRTLAILFSLMAVMAGLRVMGIFAKVAGFLLSKVHSILSLELLLVGLCFFGSMFITNDVSLITFVPLTLEILELLDRAQTAEPLASTESQFPAQSNTRAQTNPRTISSRRSEIAGLRIRIIVLQTLAANLGSMLTPIGNPQNLYLYGKAGFGMGEFIRIMLPYTLLSLAGLVLWIFLSNIRNCRKATLQLSGITEIYHIGNHSASQNAMSSDQARGDLSGDNNSSRIPRSFQLIKYGILFLLCLLTVLRILPYPVTFGIVLATELITHREALKEVDYCLLLTFIGFFIFIGNLGRMEVFKNFLESVIDGRETIISVACSQIMSNVPAALLLSGFTSDYRSVLIGVNLGGLGTLIASMASLISYKLFAGRAPQDKGKYFLTFTLGNIIFLIFLLLLYFILNQSLL